MGISLTIGRKQWRALGEAGRSELLARAAKESGSCGKHKLVCNTWTGEVIDLIADIVTDVVFPPVAGAVRRFVTWARGGGKSSSVRQHEWSYLVVPPFKPVRDAPSVTESTHRMCRSCCFIEAKPYLTPANDVCLGVPAGAHT